MCSQFIIDMMDIASGMFTEILSCDLDLFEELFGVVGTLYQNAVLPIAVALLLMILTWQVFKSMFGKLGVNSEDPLELVFRSGFCLFMLVYARDIVNYVLEVAGTPYQWVVGIGITVDSFSGYISAAEAAVSVLGTDALSISLLLLIMHFVVAWNYFKLLFILAERYVLLGVLSYTAPLAFATGGSKATNNILASWSKMFGGQVMIVILDAWCLKMFLAGYGNLMASGYGFTRFFAATMCLIGFCKIAGKLDSYMASLGVSMGRTMGGLSGLGALMMAGRLLSGGGRGRGASTAASGSGHMNFGNGRPIPMGGAGVSASAGAMSDLDGNIKDGVGSGIGGIDAGNMADGFQGMESQNPDMGDGFSVFQIDDSALTGQNLPFGTPDDENGFAQGADDGMPDVPEEDGALSSMESEGGIPIGDTGMGSLEEESLSAGNMTEGGELPPIDDMENGSQILPFGNVEDMAGGMEKGEGGSIFGQETMSGVTGLEQSGESTGIGDLQDSMDSRAGNQTEGVAMGDGADGSGIPSYGETQESSVCGSSADNFDTGAIEHMDTSATIAGNAAVDARASAAVAGVSQQGGISEGLRGCYQAERDGKQYMRYDTGLYEKPKGPYQTIHENGKTYYELPKQEKAPAMLPETKAVLEKNGTLRLEKVYQQKERMEKPVKNQTGTRRRNQRRKVPDRK